MSLISKISTQRKLVQKLFPSTFLLIFQEHPPHLEPTTSGTLQNYPTTIYVNYLNKKRYAQENEIVIMTVMNYCFLDSSTYQSEID